MEIKFNNITIDRVYISEFQKDDTITIQMRQIVEREYEKGGNKGSSLSGNAFSFAEPEVKNYEENRVFTEWNADAVVNGQPMTAELAQQIMDSKPNARIYKILSNAPILTDQQKYAMVNNISNKSIADYAEKQVCRNSDGEILLDKEGKLQYRVLHFAINGHEDVDNRGNGEEFQPSALLAEAKGAGNTHLFNM